MTDAPRLRPHRRTRLLAGLLVSGLALYLLFRDVDLVEIGAHLRRANLAVLALALLVDLVAFLLIAWRACLLLGPIARYPYATVLRSVLLGFAGNNLLPARAGEIVRIGFLVQEGEAGGGQTMGVVAAERVLDLVVVIALFVLGLSVATVVVPIGATASVMAGAAAAVLGVVLLLGRHSGRMRRGMMAVAGLFGDRTAAFAAKHLEAFVEGLAGLASGWRVVPIILLTVGNWSLTALSIFIWAAAFDLTLPWYGPLVVLGILAFAQALPALPAHVGTFHVVVMWALMLFGVASSQAASVAVAGHLTKVPFTLVGVALGLPALLRRLRPSSGAAAPLASTRQRVQKHPTHA